MTTPQNAGFAKQQRENAARADVVNRLRRLGVLRQEWGPSAHAFFDHSGGRVSLEQASDFYNRATRLCREAAAEIERLRVGGTANAKP